eukprot:366281-Chlamydomonas_euryale.AAC.21
MWAGHACRQLACHACAHADAPAMRVNMCHTCAICGCPCAGVLKQSAGTSCHAAPPSKRLNAESRQRINMHHNSSGGMAQLDDMPTDAVRHASFRRIAAGKAWCLDSGSV